MSISVLKQRAKDNLRGPYGTYLLATFLAAIISSAASSAGPFAFLVTGPIMVGLAGLFLKLTRGAQGELSDMFEGFNNFVPTFLLQLLMCVFIFLWTLLFIIPGIIKAFAYSMAPYIMADNPEMSSLDAITASKIMMKGHKGRLFGLYLSYIGWFLLCMLTFGIGFIFLTPWIQASVAEFYQDILDRNADTTM